MLKKELNLEMPENKKDILKGSLTTFFSFLVFGFIPLFPYFVILNKSNDEIVPTEIFIISYACSAFAVILLGYIYVYKTKQNWIYVLKLFIVASSVYNCLFCRLWIRKINLKIHIFLYIYNNNMSELSFPFRMYPLIPRGPFIPPF